MRACQWDGFHAEEGVFTTHGERDARNVGMGSLVRREAIGQRGGGRENKTTTTNGLPLPDLCYHSMISSTKDCGGYDGYQCGNFSYESIRRHHHTAPALTKPNAKGFLFFNKTSYPAFRGSDGNPLPVSPLSHLGKIIIFFSFNSRGELACQHEVDAEARQLAEQHHPSGHEDDLPVPVHLLHKKAQVLTGQKRSKKKDFFLRRKSQITK